VGGKKLKLRERSGAEKNFGTMENYKTGPKT